MQSATLHTRSTSVRRRVRRAAAASAAAVLTAVALSGPAVAASAPATGGTQPYVPTQGSTIDSSAQGFIMSDGRICNPRWGC
jgi:hypothetical protein